MGEIRSKTCEHRKGQEGSTGGAPRRPSFGAAADGDGDRNMILGDGVLNFD
eukprot:COSAG04_NODE_564_length_12565_cov_220.319028_10_plen_51_part_00